MTMLTKEQIETYWDWHECNCKFAFDSPTSFEVCNQARQAIDLAAENEKLKAQLSTTNKRLEASVEDLRRNRKYKCDCCHYANKQGQYIPCRGCQSPISNHGDLWQWRGPQEKDGEDA